MWRGRGRRGWEGEGRGEEEGEGAELAPSCLNGTRPLAQRRSSGSGSSDEGVAMEDPGKGMEEIDAWLDDLSEASVGNAWNAADELATITSDLEALGSSLIVQAEAGSDDWNETFPTNLLAILDGEMDQLEDAGRAPPVPALGDVAKSLPSKAPGPICADDARRMGVPTLHPSIGHYSRLLPKVKGGCKGVATAKKVESGAGGAGGTTSKAAKVKSGDVAIAGDTWDKYRSRAFKRSAKEAIARGMSPSSASKYRSHACQAAKIDWATMIKKKWWMFLPQGATSPDLGDAIFRDVAIA